MLQGWVHFILDMKKGSDDEIREYREYRDKSIKEVYNEVKNKQSQEKAFLWKVLKFNDNSRNNCKIYIG